MINFMQRNYNLEYNLFQKAKHNLVGGTHLNTVYNTGWIKINSTTNVQSPLLRQNKTNKQKPEKKKK